MRVARLSTLLNSSSTERQIQITGSTFVIVDCGIDECINHGVDAAIYTPNRDWIWTWYQVVLCPFVIFIKNAN
jgi:hypothetical protein